MITKVTLMRGVVMRATLAGRAPPISNFEIIGVSSAVPGTKVTRPRER